MKILQVNSVCGVGSTGRIATDLHSVLIGNENESIVAFGRGKAISCSNTIKISHNVNLFFDLLGTRIFDLHGRFSKFVTKNFIKNIKKLNPDIIHLHNIHGYYVNYELLFTFLKQFNRPIVWTFHDCWPFTGHCVYFDYVKCSKWEKYCFECTLKNNYPKSILFDNSFSNFKNKKESFTGVNNLTIVTPSLWLKKLVKKSFLADYDVEVINNGVDVDVFKPTQNSLREKYGIKNKFIVLGVASVWEKRKGLDYFLELSKRLSDQFQIIIVGVNKKQNEIIPSNIIKICKTNNVSELAQIYSAADVFVNPTLEDNFPTTNIESLACGTPVITFNTGGSPEALNQYCGAVVEKGNIESLMDCIEGFKKTGKAIYTKNCRNHALAFFDKKDRYSDYLDLYKKIIKK